MPNPTCPKCGSDRLSLTHMRLKDAMGFPYHYEYCSCIDCDTLIWEYPPRDTNKDPYKIDSPTLKDGER